MPPICRRKKRAEACAKLIPPTAAAAAALAAVVFSARADEVRDALVHAQQTPLRAERSALRLLVAAAGADRGGGDAERGRQRLC